MLTRGLFDSLSFWPAVFWPIIFSSCFYAYLRMCQMLKERYGFSPLSGRRKTDMVVAYGAMPMAWAIEIVVHAYMFFIVGYLYVIAAIPIYIFGWVLIPAILDGFRPGLTILAITHATFVMAFMVLMGLMDINVLRALNSDIYALLVGVPANI